MTQVLFAQRSMVQAYQRCKRLRWLENYEGEAGVGLTPARKSIHLVIGSAVHSGMEILLRDGQQFLDQFAKDHDQPDVAACVEVLFEGMTLFEGAAKKNCRVIEDRAVLAALADLQKEMNDGVELDPDEMAAALAARQADGTAAPEVDMGGLVAGMSSNSAGGGSSRVEMDSPIVISFDNFAPMPAPDLAGLLVVADGPGPFEGQVQRAPMQTSDQYLKEEIAALCEGMVRAWARRRWKNLLQDFCVLEIEKEGEWVLAEFELSGECHYDANGKPVQHYEKEIHFLSRHDALLLERSTNYLYLQSFKTTGSWDRRKEMDAQVDMQGLSEAVDVEKRFGEAWQRLQEVKSPVTPADIEKSLSALVSPRVVQWLSTLPDPPQILGVRYEYLLKGSRKKDKKDAMNPDRYVQESILCRAWKQEGITSDDRRWAWTYDWNDETGKGRRLDYRSWQKSAVWKTMKIADWIDLLDEGKVQEGALNEQGEPLDALAEQFVPVLTVYRNSDEMLDLLEQMESQEVQIARDVVAVRQAEEKEGYAGKRTALNRLFPQTRTACSYPGVCQYRTTSSQPGFCFGASDPFHDQTVLDRFQTRVANHPQENSTLIHILVDK